MTLSLDLDERLKRPSEMSNNELRREVEHIVAMMTRAGDEGVGTNINSRVRITSVMRECARRMRAKPPLPSKTAPA